MTSERQGSETFARAAAEWRRLTPLVERCLDLPENERASFLAGHLNDETHYLEKALDLAAAAAAAESLETPALGIAPPDREASDRRQGTDASEAIPSAPADPLPAPPEEIPGFEILSLLGEGGMGVVYLAEQRRPVERRVALKIAHSRIDAESRRRLASERQAMARLNHPNIARILEAGSTESGRPYFAMEWIRGEPITLACDRMKLSVEERLRLFLGACSGLQHAHQKGVLHRDIKPTNVLVSTDEDPPIAKIIDFGIAKALGDTQLAEGIEKTSGLIGTPAYMSPEALNQNPESDLEEIDTRSDVYSLGVLLFELLVGERPALREPGEGPLAYLLRVSRLDVPSPLARWRSLDLEERAARASLRGVSPQALERRLRDDLVWIVHRATVRDPEQRYASASELAADIERHLADEAVLASPPSTLYRLRKTARRHRLAVASALLVLLTLVGGVVARSLEAERARRSAEEARAANEETTGALNFMISLLTSASPDNAQGRELTALDLLENGSTRLLEGELSETPEARVRLLYATT
ncbi:MAG: serine/threonine-protein kinase, partial [Acidobacteriota bacterium]